ncbi:hypothetical protein [Neobacillus cucumis]|uniref:hypothetical protein n=1 Tax=Neobacillus cucumis TaxID=1740721 RepID=UPI0028533BD3|nr:hypothetical protein [Neobacillus cucumis]MDR4947921.1 hypothetical protein [Neobacillus cucumis]
MGKNAFTAQEKYELIVGFEDRQTSILDFCVQHNISKYTIKNWTYLLIASLLSSFQETFC